MLDVPAPYGTWMVQIVLPADGTCPMCSGAFHLQARTVCLAMHLAAKDELEWRCVQCGHEEVERRRQTDEIDGEWPPSRFQREHGPP